jgi:signal transduction histidine kinase
MKERIESVGGSITIAATQNQGTTVTVLLPAPNKEQKLWKS